jgi:histidine ammonia-lyase
MTVVLSTTGVSPADVDAVAGGEVLVWGDDLDTMLDRAAAGFDAVLAAGARVYGVTTEVADRSSFDIAPENRSAYQLAMLRSHACGTGAVLDRRAARAVWVTKVASLATCRSGCSVQVVRALTDALNAGLAPAIPTTGSLAASGDLVPSAHAALPLLGEGELLAESGQPVPAAPLLSAHGLAPVALGPRDGLSLVNGTSVTSALATVGLLDAERVVAAADVLAAAGVEVRSGHRDAFAEQVISARPHPGARVAADRVGRALGSAGAAGRPAGQDFHDAYAWRCVPQVHGAAQDAIAYLRSAVVTELASCTDNPIMGPIAGTGRVWSGGNFHAAPLGIPVDSVTVAVTVLAGLSRQRLVRMMSARSLPAWLVGPGGSFGLSMLVATATAHVLELGGLTPASTRWLPVDDVEDHVANATAAARQLRTAVDGARHVLAAEAIAIAAAADLRGRCPAGPGLRAVHALVRGVCEPPAADRSDAAALTALAQRIDTLAELVAPTGDRHG